MPNITVKNIPPELYRLLKKNAEVNRRSINSEIIVCIERALRSRRINPDEILARAKNLRAKTAGHPIADAEIVHAKAEGRL
jgi:hypothetical protein